MVCPACGTQVTVEARHCTHCGAALWRWSARPEPQSTREAQQGSPVNDLAPTPPAGFMRSAYQHRRGVPHKDITRYALMGAGTLLSIPVFVSLLLGIPRIVMGC